MKHIGLLGLSMFSTVLLATVTSALAAEGVDLTGVIRDDSGAPVAGAAVMVNTAGVKKGYSSLCPSCYADCAKKAVSGSDGRFVLPDLSRDLRFTIAVLAPGYKPRMTRRLDPANQMLLARLTPMHLEKMDPKTYFTGQVQDEEGHPIVHAVVETVHGDVEGGSGRISDLFDEYVVSDDKGAFVVTAKKGTPIKYLTMRVFARGYAPQIALNWEPKRADRTIKLNRGVTVSGVLMHDDQPVQNVQVGLVQKDRSMEAFVGEQKIGTDAKGRFTFTNINGAQEYLVYGIMDAVRDMGAVKAVSMRLKEPGSHTDAGILRVQGGHRLKGKVALDDQGKIPPNTKIMLSREEAWDHQMMDVRPDGSFEFKGLPEESYSLTLRFPGYEISEHNISLDRYNTSSLIGRIDRNIDDLCIWMERQPPEGKKVDFNARFKALEKMGWKQDKVKQEPMVGYNVRTP